MAEKKHIFLASPHMSEEGYEQAFVKEAFDTNWVAPLGKNVNEFEREICEVIGAGAAAALVSGTSAIHLALKSAGVQKGDIVFCQSLTFSATANPILYEGAVPVFLDSEEDTWNMSPQVLERAFEIYPHPKAVIVVNLYGIPAKLKEIRDICRRHDTILIEDAAESLGSSYEGQMTGTFGELAALSFNGNKIITSSGGGMMLANGENAAERAAKARFWATQSKEPARHYQHEELGYNYRMSNIVAGIGRGQLRVLKERIRQKQNIFRYYKEQLSGLPGLSMMPIPEGDICNCWLSCIRLSPDCTVKPLDIILALEAEDVESRPIWKPLHLQPVFEEYDYLDNGGVAQRIFEEGVCLPSDTKMTQEELERVVEAIKKLWK